MDLDHCSSPGALIVSVILYLTKVLEEWPEKLRRSKLHPYLENLFTIRDDDNRGLLPKEVSLQFHWIVAQLKFLCMRARPGIQKSKYHV